ELEDLHRLGGLGLDLLDLFRLNDHVLVLAVLVSFDDLAAVENLIVEGADELLLHSVVVRAMKLVERDARAPRTGMQTHRHGDKTEGKISRPDGGRHSLCPR